MLGVAAEAGQSKSVSCSLNEESKIITGLPLENASMAASTCDAMGIGGRTDTHSFRSESINLESP